MLNQGGHGVCGLVSKRGASILMFKTRQDAGLISSPSCEVYKIFGLLGSDSFSVSRLAVEQEMSLRACYVPPLRPLQNGRRQSLWTRSTAFLKPKIQMSQIYDLSPSSSFSHFTTLRAQTTAQVERWQHSKAKEVNMMSIVFRTQRRADHAAIRAFSVAWRLRWSLTSHDETRRWSFLALRRPPRWYVMFKTLVQTTMSTTQWIVLMFRYKYSLLLLKPRLFTAHFSN